LEEAEFEQPRVVAKNHQKAEPYSEIKHPRVISTINGVDKREYSTFTYPIFDAIGNLTWYAFSKTPKEIAEFVASFAVSSQEGLIETDFSKFDGRVSPALREFEKQFYQMLVADKYVDQVIQLHSKMYNLHAYMDECSYETGTSRASGGPDTAGLNTVDNAFLAFCANVASNKFKTWTEAYENLGIYGGDDGLSVLIDPEVYAKSCEEWGMKITSTVTYPGKVVTFLARIFGPDVWTGDDNSMCDIGRQLPKFHLTLHRPLTNQQAREKLHEKLSSFRLTDRNTPVFKEIFNNRVFMQLPLVATDVWWAQYGPQVQFPNRFAGWMSDVLLDHIPSFQYYEWTVYIAALTNPYDLLVNPGFGILTGEEVNGMPGEPANDNTSINGEARPRKHTEHGRGVFKFELGRRGELDQDIVVPTLDGSGRDIGGDAAAQKRKRVESGTVPPNATPRSQFDTIASEGRIDAPTMGTKKSVGGTHVNKPTGVNKGTGCEPKPSAVKPQQPVSQPEKERKQVEKKGKQETQSGKVTASATGPSKNKRRNRNRRNNGKKEESPKTK